MPFDEGSLNAMRCATKWLNLNNRGCLTHGYQNHETSATKWFNFKIHCSAHFGAEIVYIIYSVGFHPRLLKYHPYQGDEKKQQKKTVMQPELHIQIVIEPECLLRGKMSSCKKYI